MQLRQSVKATAEKWGGVQIWTSYTKLVSIVNSLHRWTCSQGLEHMFFTLIGKLEHQVETHWKPGRTCALHIERAKVGGGGDISEVCKFSTCSHLKPFPWAATMSGVTSDQQALHITHFSSRASIPTSLFPLSLKSISHSELSSLFLWLNVLSDLRAVYLSHSTAPLRQR